MIIPIGHEENTIRRQPWVTYSVMVLCVLAFVATHFTRQEQLRRTTEFLSEAVEYYLKRPYLELDERLKEMMVQGGGAGVLEAFSEWAERFGGDRPADPREVAAQQRELDRLTDEAFASAASTSDRKWGLIPARVTWVGLIAHMFLHGGWMHLLGNLLFLYLAAPFVEDVWGRPLFAGFYLAGGVAAALVFVFRYPQLDAPLIGASGAVAGVMGAFLVRHWKKRIRFFYWIGFFFRGTFSSPAWVILPLWFLRELVYAHTMDTLAPGSGGGGVAYWAHIGGFAFGVVAAVALRGFGIEKHFVDPSLDSRLTLVERPALERALAARQDGRPDDAWRLLWKEVRSGSNDVDTLSCLWDLAVETARPGEAVSVSLRLIKEEIRHGEAMPAYMHWRQLVEGAPSARVDPALEAKLAETLARDNLPGEAAEVVREAVKRLDAETPTGVLVRLARYGDGGGRAKAAALALAHPDLPKEARRELEAVAASGEAGPAKTPTRLPVETRGRTLKVTTVIPLGLKEDQLVVQLPEQGKRSLPMHRVKAVAVAALQSAPAPAGPLMDLLLDAPWGDAAELRILRMHTDSFDVRKLVPSAGSSRDAFHMLVERVLTASGAVPLPDPVAVRGDPVTVYDSLEAYEREVLGATRASPGPA